MASYKSIVTSQLPFYKQVQAAYTEEVNLRLQTVFNAEEPASLEATLTLGDFHTKWEKWIVRQIESDCKKHYLEPGIFECQGHFECIVRDYYRKGLFLYQGPEHYCERVGFECSYKSTEECDAVVTNGKLFAVTMFEQAIDSINAASNVFAESLNHFA